MAYQTLLYDKIERTGRITLNRARYRNAQSTVLLKELALAFEEAVADDAVKVIILAGAGEHFSAGHDLGTPDERENPNSYFNTKGITKRHIGSWQLFLDN